MDDALSTATWLCERGYAVHWLRHRSKAPLFDEWSTREVAPACDLIETYQQGCNVGIRLGKWSVPEEGHGLLVLDFDINDPDERFTPYEVLNRFWDAETLEVKSGSGYGRHFYFLCPLEKLPSKANQFLAKSDTKIAVGKTLKWRWAIEVLSTGKQVVCPPSVHPDTGGIYEWATGMDTPISVIPECILDAVKEDDIPVAPKVSVSTTPVRQRMAAPKSIKELSAIHIADQFKSKTWESILEPHGWHKVKEKADRAYWRRPGKNGKKDISASTIGDVFYCFSSSTDFKAEKGYSKFSAYALLEHNGDMSKASRHLISISA